MAHSAEADVEAACDTWGHGEDDGLGPSLLPSSSSSSSSQPPPSSRASVLLSLASLLLAIPSLVGAWCWPGLVAAIVSGTASAAARQTGHVVSLALTSILMAVVVAVVARGRATRRRHLPTWGARNGPLLLVCLAVPLVLADLVRHVLLDTGVWPGCIPAGPDGSECAWYSATMYGDGADTAAEENLTHLSVIGVLFTIVATYTGYGALMCGTLWNADALTKLRAIRAQWRRLRGGGGGDGTKGLLEGEREGAAAIN